MQRRFVGSSSMHDVRSAAVVAGILISAACASAPPAAPTPPGPSFEQKMSWVLRLEDQRVLRDPAPPAPPPAPAPVKGRKPQVSVSPPPPPPDLVRLLSDGEARVRRRAALAIGRVGLAEGIQPLTALLASDQDAEVRQVAAFALGLIGDSRAREALLPALVDASPLVKGSAAEALALIGDATAAEPIARMAAQIIESGAFSTVPGDEDDARRDTPSAAVRLAIFALARLRAYPALASAVLNPDGQPRMAWWPVAYALQRVEDANAVNALLTLARDANAYTRAFAVKGLGAMKARSALPVLMPLLTSGDRGVLIETIRALGKIGDVSAAAPLLKLLRDASVEPGVKAEIVGALGGLHATAGAAQQLPPGVADDLLDLLSDRSPPMRAAALRATAALDPDNLLIVLSGLDPDPHWTVRAALATLLGTLSPAVATPRLVGMLKDEDQRVIPAVLAALTRLKAPEAPAILTERLKADDPAVRAAAAAGLGELVPAGAAEALADAYEFGQRDTIYIARTAAMSALTKYGAAVAEPVLRKALTDKDWAVRVRAAMLLKEVNPTVDAAAVDAQIRPAPTTIPAETYTLPRLTTPDVSTTLFIDTDRGSIEIELAVLDAPLTVDNFVTLARKGYFNGLTIHRVVPNFVVQDGDPRGDGEGGPGYTMRDEISQRPYLRGTLGMALDPWRDTGGSQFFIALSPQPHLDAKYTVFGRVITGMDVVDKIQQGDVIRRVRVWDGQNPMGGREREMR
jgi:cyclophilin family peptidyl-prolyl cis-trans isomerase/HEAT repeat protein